MNNNNHPTYSILFVDDEEMARKYFVKAVSNDFDVLTAANVSEAREILGRAADRIGVLITDQRMPNENGVVLLRHVREHHPHIIRLLTTAYADLEGAIEAVNTGEILRYIHKPWKLPELRVELKHAMQFFELQKENQELIREKLNVIQRMAEVNRVRDLLMFGSGCSHLRHVNQGMLAFLMQVPVKAVSSSENADVPARWHMEEDITKVMNLTAEIMEATRTPSGQADLSETVHYYSLWSSALKSAGVGAAVPADLAAIKEVDATGNEEQLKLLLNTMISSCAALGTEGPVTTVFVGDGLIEFKVESPKTSWQSTLSPATVKAPLLAAFLVAAHHGAELKMSSDNSTSAGLSVRLPLTPEAVALPPPELHWLDAVLARFEGL